MMNTDHKSIDTRSLSAEDARRELYSLLDSSLTSHQILLRVLDIGSQYLGIEHSHVTSIDESDNRWEVISSTDSPDGPYPQGLVADLRNAYCRRTIQQSSPVALHDAGNQGWANDDAYHLHKLETYLGIRIDVFGEQYGTICFVDREARQEPFTESERIFVELAGQVVQYALERAHYQKNLANRDRLIAVLNRVLRHNLRNELNVVYGYAQMLQSSLSGDHSRWAETIASTTTELLELAEKGRQLEEVTSEVPISRPIDIVPLVENTVVEVSEQYPAVDFTVDTPERAIALGSPRLSVAVKELLDNAATYGGADPEVEVTVSHSSDKTTVSVEDNGDGLPDTERRILTGDVETPLEHGSGLGFVLVYWLLTSLDGDIVVPETPSGTTINLDLPKPSSTFPESHRFN